MALPHSQGTSSFSLCLSLPGALSFKGQQALHTHCYSESCLLKENKAVCDGREVPGLSCQSCSLPLTSDRSLGLAVYLCFALTWRHLELPEQLSQAGVSSHLRRS